MHGLLGKRGILYLDEARGLLSFFQRARKRALFSASNGVKKTKAPRILFTSQGDADNRKLQLRIEELEKKLKEVTQKREQVEAVRSEKDKRINHLERELANMQAKEDTLNETIGELKEVETVLKSQV